MARLLLFDVDQTILSTRGGDRKALNIAFQEMFGVADGFDGIEFAGRMDLAIVGDAFRRQGVDIRVQPDALACFKDSYVRHLERVLAAWTDGVEYPGVRRLLDVLVPRKDVHLGLVTGNFRESAFVKLRRYGFDGYFVEGGFGGDCEERSKVVAVGIERCKRVTGIDYAPEEIYVIGDSPADILAGRANGIKTVGVATGYSGIDKLRSYGPAHAFQDLSDIEAFLREVLGAQEHQSY